MEIELIFMSNKQKNIYLRSVDATDKKYFFKWWKEDKELIKLTSGNFEKISAEKLNKYFKNILCNNNNFVICLGDRVIGSIYFEKMDKSTFRFPVVIGEKKYWGSGYGSCAIRAILYLGFVVYKLNKAYLEVRPENIRAINVYTKLGFEYVGFKKYPKNKYQPIVLKMELLKRNWNKGK